MPIDVNILVVTDETGEELGRYPVRKSALLQFERKYLRPFNEASPLDQAIMSYRTSHGRWPKDDDALDAWVDSVNIETESVDGSEEEPNPTRPDQAPSS